MKKTFIKVIIACMMIAALCGSYSPVKAASNKYWLSGIITAPKTRGYISKSKLTRNKLTIWGRGKKSKTAYSKGKLLKNKKRSFRITPKTKYYVADDDFKLRVPKKKVKAALKTRGMECFICIKNKRIIKIYYMP